MERERLVSVVAGRASKFMFSMTPSELIPFKGKFPLVESFESEQYRDSILNTENIEDLPEKFQKAVIKGNRIALLEDGFKRYLNKLNINTTEFLKLNNPEKSDKLLGWMNQDCIDFNQLKIQ